MTGIETYAPFLGAYASYIVPFVLGCVIAAFFFRRPSAERDVRDGPAPQKTPVTSRDMDGRYDTDEAEMHPLDHGKDEYAEPDDVPPEEKEHIPFEGVTYTEKEMLERSRAFMEDMGKRRTLRFFSEKPVPREVIDNIVSTTGSSPSGANVQPWTFVVVSNKDVKSRIREIIEEEERVNYARRMGENWVNDLKILRTSWEKEYLDKAPYLIIIFKQSYGILPDGRKQTHYYAEISVSIATGIMLAAIQNAGLVTVTSTPMNAGPQLRTLLQRPVNEKVIMLLPVGFPAEGATVPPITKKPLAEIMINVD